MRAEEASKATTPTPDTRDSAPAAKSRLLAPLSSGIFAALFVAQLGSNVGSWMQAVGAQWLIGSLGGGVTLVALAQTASTLPVMLLAVPAGALADIVDRRRLLIVGQIGSMISAGLLALFTGTGSMTVTLLLTLTFVLGCCQAVISPSWQAIQPELVAGNEVPAAMTLQAANTNISRAIGPALGGLVVASLGPEWVFAINALSFLGTCWVLYRWRRPKTASAFGPEHLTSAVRLAFSYVRHAPALRVVLWRVFLFIPAGSCLWALLPVVARGPLGLGANGYGVLLGALGVGAVAGAFLLPSLQRAVGVNVVMALSSVVFAVGTLVLAVLSNVYVINAFMVLAGLGWIGALATLNIAAQAILPPWVRARGIAVYLVIFMGGQAVGSALWGLVAQNIGLNPTLYTATALLLVGALSVAVLPLPKAQISTHVTTPWPEPVLELDPDQRRGPVETSVEYRVPQEHAAGFVNQMQRVRGGRLRTGAERWTLFQDGEDVTLWVETYRMSSWAEHERQHHERVTDSDEQQLQAVRDLLTSDPAVRHLFTPFDPAHPHSGTGASPPATAPQQPESTPGSKPSS